MVKISLENIGYEKINIVSENYGFLNPETEFLMVLNDTFGFTFKFQLDIRIKEINEALME